MMAATTQTLTAGATATTMTLEEIESFVKSARDCGATGNEHPTVRVTMTGAIKNMTIRVAKI